MSRATNLARFKGGGIRLVATLALSLVIAAATGGCAARQPPRAAMVPWSATGDYGYAEAQIGPDRYEVTFTSPRLWAERGAANSHGLEAEKLMVYELALWRTAQLAQEMGYSAFLVEQGSRDIDLTIQNDASYRAVPYPFMVGGPRHWSDEDWAYRYWPGYVYAMPYWETATGRVKAKLTVKLLRTMSADAFDAAATLDRLRRQYGSAQFRRAIYAN